MPVHTASDDSAIVVVGYPDIADILKNPRAADRRYNSRIPGARWTVVESAVFGASHLMVEHDVTPLVDRLIRDGLLEIKHYCGGSYLRKPKKRRESV